MSKIAPGERWRRDGLERCQAFGLSTELKRLRGLGLGILGRDGLVPEEEWWQEMNGQGPMISKEYREFQRVCEETGLIFGLAPWTVEWMCLLEGYQPENSIHVVEAFWPKIRVITKSQNESFLGWLIYEAWRLGTYVVQKNGSVVTELICVPYPQRPEEPLTSSDRPPLAAAFWVSTEIPPGYPPEATAELGRNAAQLERELARQLGYQMPYRLRNSPLTTRVAELRVGRVLSSGEIYEVVDEIYGEEDLSEDPKFRNIIKSQRNRLSQRMRARVGGEGADRMPS